MHSERENRNDLTRRVWLRSTAGAAALRGLVSWPGIVHAAKQTGTTEQIIDPLPGNDTINAPWIHSATAEPADSTGRLSRPDFSSSTR